MGGAGALGAGSPGCVCISRLARQKKKKEKKGSASNNQGKKPSGEKWKMLAVGIAS